MHFQVDDDTIIGSAYALFINTVWGVFWGGGGYFHGKSEKGPGNKYFEVLNFMTAITAQGSCTTQMMM